ncbi:unnamed protein product [Brassica oleracea]
MGLHVRSPYQRVHGWVVAAWRLSSPWVSVCGLSLEVKLCRPWLKFFLLRQLHGLCLSISLHCFSSALHLHDPEPSS